ncbi:MAG TPA: bifunctional helix-turn-helix transcriptional regulator/GNAT family N-acetyltransferase [Woeseiaceae bacterium]|nr:bifunctional helix-turn-helix transcriptional regulator/GNAT family N-acetyltransferase [Woeseiaceae bacterium]
MPTAPLDSHVTLVRNFNRFYTRQAGLLEEGLLKSEFSLTEARILYELAHRAGLTAAALGKDLGLDPGYVSRILKKFEGRGFLARLPSNDDGRQSLLTLTEAGRRAFAPLDQASRNDVAAMLNGLPASGRETLLQAMLRIQRLLGGDVDERLPCIFRSHQPGDIGWITHRQAVLYNREYGWDETYEALVAEILAAFVRNFDPQRERSWVVEREGEVVGCVFVMRKSDEIAQLRLLYVEPSARGLGIGGRLVDECIRFARNKGYRRMMLWTNDVLVSARRIYESAGFQLTSEERHHSFGKDLVGQTWELEL